MSVQASYGNRPRNRRKGRRLRVISVVYRRGECVGCRGLVYRVKQSQETVCEYIHILYV